MGRKKKVDMYLSEEELLTIRLSEKEVEIAVKDGHISKHKREILDLQYKVSILTIENESRLIKESLNDKIKSQQNKLKCMATKRNIEGKWSYNPETREVVKEG